MGKIEKWLSDFQDAWKNHDIEKVLSLFSSDVEYWENPFLKVSNLEDLRKEWEYIKNQNDIKIESNIFSACNDKFTVRWDLGYKDLRDGSLKKFSGVYLIALNEEDRCNYFFHCGEKETRSIT